MPAPPPGKDVLLEIDVQGAAQVKDQYPDALLIFLDAPTEAEQRARLEARGDSPERIEQRLALAAEERQRARVLGATSVVNDDLDRATAAVAAIITTARAARRAHPS